MVNFLTPPGDDSEAAHQLCYLPGVALGGGVLQFRHARGEKVAVANVLDTLDFFERLT